MDSASVKDLATRLSSEASLPDCWDGDLPRYCAILLNNGFELVVAQTPSKLYTVSLVHSSTQQVVSIVVGDVSEANIDDIVTRLHAGSAGSSSETARAANSNHVGSVGPELADPRETTPIMASGVNGSPWARGDPNAPPGFEDEHRLRDPPPNGVHIAFDPDHDLYPPGGPNPRLGPLGPGPFNGSLRGNGSGRGMHPQPFGSNSHPSIRYDPTSPFQ